MGRRGEGQALDGVVADQVYVAVQPPAQAGQGIGAQLGVVDPREQDVFQRGPAVAGLDELAGGVDYLKRMTDAVLSLSLVTDYANVVRDASMRREIIHLSEEAILRAREPDATETAETQREVIEESLFKIGRADPENVIPVGEAVAQAIAMAKVAKKKGGVTGITTGIPSLDKRLGGLAPSDLIIVAGRPGMGKTALATTLLLNAAIKGIAGAMFSLEMTATQIGARILANRVEISTEIMRTGRTDDQQFSRLEIGRQFVAGLPIFLLDTPAVTVSSIYQQARRLKRSHDINLIIVDHIGLIAPPPNILSRVHQIEHITGRLKALAKDLNVPVVALSQLSRRVEYQDDKRPGLADLRDSGSIEQDADVVLFLYRKEYYLRRAEPDPIQDAAGHHDWTNEVAACANMLDLIFGKYRDGDAGSALKLGFSGALSRVYERAAPTVQAPVGPPAAPAGHDTAVQRAASED